ncbi:MAG: hypothetical protein FJ096_09640, partial [Deltaproteobacteria bacterium]|nr:hypothetical protein [Deltaproteobacteria bacterium]
EDSCDGDTGDCLHDPVTPDLDADGRRAPLPGRLPGDPGACGDDCNDASPDAFPGNLESCDGVDNDCNGVVDDGAEFVPLDAAPLRISGNIAPAGPGGLAFGGDAYLAVYWGAKDGADTYTTRLDASGNKLEPSEQRIALQNADTSGGPVVWVGDRFGVVWQDRRDGDYEIYFNELGPDGKKVLADVRVTDAFDFSINPDLAWNGSEFVVTWQDRRNGRFEVFAQRIGLDGKLAGEPVNVSGSAFAPAEDSEAPSIASGAKTLGFVYATGPTGAQELIFQTAEQTTLADASSRVTISLPGVEAVGPQIAWNEDRYVVAWYHRSASGTAARAVYATALDESGTVLTPPTQISEPPSGRRSRYPQLMPLGDRLLFVYSDDRDENQGYELYSRMVGADLVPATAERRLTNAPFDSVYPTPTFGPNGDVGVLFRDDRTNGVQHVYFTRLGCVAGP